MAEENKEVKDANHSQDTSKKGVGKTMEEIKETIYREVCPRCGKEIKSLSKEQVDYNFKAHLITCKKNER